VWWAKTRGLHVDILATPTENSTATVRCVVVNWNGAAIAAGDGGE